MQIDRQKLEKYAKAKSIKFIVLFGSQTNGSLKKRSDFDVAVFLKNRKDFFDNFDLYSDLLDNLSKILDIDMDKLDLTDLANANILLRYEITSKGKLLFGDEDDYAQYRTFAFRDYLDAQSLFELEDLLIKKRHQLLRQAII